MKTALNIGLWVVQALLAVLFLFQGVIKFAPPPNLPATMQWLYDLYKSSPALSAFIGVAELAGAAGLILPGLTKIRPRLTIWAAVGLMIVMLLAAIYHLQRGEPSIIGMNAVVLVLSGLIAYGRWRIAPLPARA
jgi:uncharacterized membrane protein YphA (DoxX/SURF4 family)